MIDSRGAKVGESIVGISFLEYYELKVVGFHKCFKVMKIIKICFHVYFINKPVLYRCY